MENLQYFCSVKRFKTTFSILTNVLLMLFLTAPAGLSAQESHVEAIAEDTIANPMDSVEISLLTCQPHDEVYSLYGHTAIRLQDHRKKGFDYAFNYGVFNFKAPFFVARFVFGLTDYELGAYPYSLFLQEYQHFGSMVTEQVLNLTPEEKARLYAALMENIRPENSVYRYNYFYNNCTTKARDIIEQCISGKIEYAERKDYAPTYRDMVHDMTQNNPWSRWGNDLLLGIKADQATDQRQQEFLPNNLLYDFDHAQIYSSGQYRPLVKERRTPVQPGVQTVQQGFPLSPTACALILLAICIILTIVQYKTKRIFRLWSVLMMFVDGAIGLVLFLMLFSQHPTVNLNLQLIFFNPIHLVFLWPVLRGKPARYYWLLIPILGVLFLIGGLFQHYAEGIYVLALCLLLQSILHIDRKIKK